MKTSGRASRLPNCTYRTRAGSIVRISGKHGGIAEVEFDWLEEGGCFDCKVNPYPADDGYDWYMTWDCEYCGGGKAILGS